MWFCNKCPGSTILIKKFIFYRFTKNMGALYHGVYLSCMTMQTMYINPNSIISKEINHAAFHQLCSIPSVMQLNADNDR